MRLTLLGIEVQVLFHVLGELFALALHVLSETVNLRAGNIVGLAVGPDLLQVREDLLEILVDSSFDIFLRVSVSKKGAYLHSVQIHGPLHDLRVV